MRKLRVGACQTPEFLGQVRASLRCIEDLARQADTRGVELLLFPECFLQGYLVEREHLRRHAVSLRSAWFAAVLRRLRWIDQVLVFGVIEQDDGRFFNTAVVVSKGELLGRYRKIHLGSGESLFDPGDGTEFTQISPQSGALALTGGSTHHWDGKQPFP